VEVRDAGEGGTVLVPERQVEQKIAGRLDAGRGELAPGGGGDRRLFQQRIGKSKGRGKLW